MELKPLFKDIADAIREKDGTTDSIKAADFPGRVRGIRGGDNGHQGDVTTGLKPLFQNIADAIREVDGTTDEIRAADFPERIRAIRIARGVIEEMPTQKGALTYSGGEQQPEWDGLDPEQLTIDGTLSATDAGSYEATVTPTERYEWPDGTQEPRPLSWSIGKAAGSLALGKTSVTLNTSKLTDTVTVTRPGDGAITASSSNTSVATVSVSGTTLTISHVNQATGTATITVKVAAGTNHTAPADKTVAVTAQFMPAKKALNDMTWAEIRQVSDAGKGSEYWNVGDRKGILVNGTIGTLSVNTTLYVFILGFDHNSAKEGKGIQFGTFKTALSGGTDVCLVSSGYATTKTDGSKVFNMNHKGNYNYGGWKACDLRYDILGSTNKAPSSYCVAKTTSSVGYDAPASTPTNPVANTLMAALPADLRAVMKPITKYTDNVGNACTAAESVTASVDYLPSPAEFEVLGTRVKANKNEQDFQLQYAYYKAGNSFVKYRHSANTTTACPWTRSPSSNHKFCVAGPYANTNPCSTSGAYGIAPVLMV